MKPSELTPVLLTYDEAPNVERTLNRLGWASTVVVVDSGSSDETRSILSRYSNVRCVVRCFDDHASQWNFALENTEIRSEWVLALDADYVLTHELVDEILALDPVPEVAGYRVHFRYCVHGRPLRGSVYPPVILLYRRKNGRYEQDGHTQRLRLRGKVGSLKGVVLHDDRKGLDRWLWSQARYASLEADLLRRTSWGDLRAQDRLRRLVVITPWLVPLYCLTVKGGILDGWPGIYYAFQRGLAETLLSLKLMENWLSAGHR